MSYRSLTDVWIERAEERIRRGDDTEADIMMARRPGQDVSAQIERHRHSQRLAEDRDWLDRERHRHLCLPIKNPYGENKYIHELSVCIIADGVSGRWPNGRIPCHRDYEPARGPAHGGYLQEQKILRYAFEAITLEKLAPAIEHFMELCGYTVGVTWWERAGKKEGGSK